MKQLYLERNTYVKVISVQKFFKKITELLQCFWLSKGTYIRVVYSEGMSPEKKQEIEENLGISRGKFPLDILRSPLSTKRVFIVQCEPLLENMLSRIKTWTTGFLSCVGRNQLIKFVMFPVQVFWNKCSS